MTPAQVHYGLAQKVYEDRCQVLRSAYEKNPERFKGRVPKRAAENGMDQQTRKRRIRV